MSSLLSEGKYSKYGSWESVCVCVLTQRQCDYVLHSSDKPLRTTWGVYRCRLVYLKLLHSWGVQFENEQLSCIIVRYNNSPDEVCTSASELFISCIINHVLVIRPWNISLLDEIWMTKTWSVTKLINSSPGKVPSHLDYRGWGPGSKSPL